MKEMKRKSVGCYVRVSTISQDIDKFSINGQITQIKEYCQFHGYDVLIFTLTVVFQEKQ